MEWRHTGCVDDREASQGDGRGVRDEEVSDEREKEESRRVAEEVSSSERNEADVMDMATVDEEELWRRVERDGFPKEDTEEVGET